ncbi:MAG: hypothetical protein QW706_08760 [Candidatus Nezhaarchaeales archaeon]
MDDEQKRLSKLATLIGVKTVTAGKRKVYLEIRRTRDKGVYSLTIVSRNPEVVEAIREGLVKAGYSPSGVYYDGYQFARVNITGLTLTDLYYIAVMVKYWASLREPGGNCFF